MSNKLNDNKNYLLQSNELIEGFKNEMKNVGELKAFYTLCAMFYHDNYTDKTVTETKVNVKSLLECMGYSTTGNNPKFYIEHLKKLREHAFFTAQDEKYKDNYEFLPCFRISVPKAWVEGKETIREDVTIKWEERFIPFITNQYDEEGNQIGNYTLLLLQSLVPLRSKAAQELYIQMSKIAGLDYPITKTVEEIRDMLGLTAPSYDATKEVTRTLKGYIEDINKNTNIKISYRIIKNPKDKRKTDGYSFRVRNNDIKSNMYFSGCPDVYITQQDYINLTKDKDGTEITLLKRKANELQELINPKKEGHIPQPIKNHYTWLKNAVNTSSERDERQKPKQSIYELQSGRISRQPSYDLEQIKFDAINNTEIE